MMHDNHELPFERRHTPVLTEDEIEDIAERAAEKAIAKMEAKLYQSVGKTFINRIFQLVGAVIIGAALYLHQKGFLHISEK